MTTDLRMPYRGASLATPPTLASVQAQDILLPDATTRHGELQHRRQLGRFDTPRPLAQSVADWAILTARDSIFEPSAGAGVFIHSAVYRLTGMHAPRPRSRLWACDVDPVACQQTIRETGIPADQVWNADVMTLSAADGIAHRRFDVIIGNPPFVSVHTMLADQRLSARAAAERLGCPIDKKASLWAYVLVACSRALTDGGRLGFILPQAALHAGYAREVMHTVARGFRRSMMISVRESCFANVGTKERVIVFCGDGYDPNGRSGTGPALVECASVADVRSFLVAARGDQFGTVPKLNGHAVPHLLSTTAAAVVHLEGITHSHGFGDFADVKIGAVTGANDFFILSEPDRRRWRLPLSAVIPVLPKFGDYTGLRFTRPQWKRIRADGERCWLLMPKPDEKRRTVAAYLETFDAAQRAQNRTFSKRAHWFRTILPPRPHAFLKYMGSSGPYVVWSTFACQCTNSTHAIYFKPDITATKRRAILLSLRSTFSKLSAEFEGRSYGSDALKLEPSEAKRVRLILPGRLSAVRIQRLFATVHGLLAKSDEDQATRLVDDWLYEAVPALEKEIPRRKAAALLAQARVRRRGTRGR